MKKWKIYLNSKDNEYYRSEPIGANTDDNIIVQDVPPPFEATVQITWFASYRSSCNVEVRDVYTGIQYPTTKKFLEDVFRKYRDYIGPRFTVKALWEWKNHGGARSIQILEIRDANKTSKEHLFDDGDSETVRQLIMQGR